jgi:3-dehydroquinate synthase
MFSKTEIKITQKTKTYPIFLGENIFEQIPTLIDLQKYSKILILTDKKVAGFWLQKVKSVFLKNNVIEPEKIKEVVIPSGEKNKNLQIINYIWQKMIEYNLDRKSLVICLGGGVVGDLGGFVASTYMRGLDFIALPTTLLSQVDSSVGGKTGFDFFEQKNVIGTFAQPIAVFIDILSLKTLPNKEFNQGFGEIIKYGLAQDKDFWGFLFNINFDYNLAKKKDLKDVLTTKTLKEIIQKCFLLKAEIVQKDETEKLGLRKILNFGHTFGHSLEMFSFEQNQHNLLHGQSVALGILVSSKISVLLGLITQSDLEKIKKTLQKFELPIKYFYTEIFDKKSKNLVDIKEILYQKMLSDKKNSNQKINWILLQKFGKVLVDQEVPKNIVLEAFDEVLVKL